jgi:hypothetical protein
MLPEARSFELYLMAQMRGEARIEAALSFLRITPEEARAAAHHLGHEVGFDRIGHGIDLYRRILGAPIETVSEPGLKAHQSFAGSLRHRFSLPLWPTLDFIIRSHRDGWAWGPEFIRKPGEPIPGAGRPEDLEPWSIVESDVLERCGPFAAEDAWNFGKDATYFVERAGARFRIALLFDFALLQRIDVSAIGP